VICKLYYNDVLWKKAKQHFANSRIVLPASFSARYYAIVRYNSCCCLVSVCMSVWMSITRYCLDTTGRFELFVAWKLPPAYALSGNFCHGKSIVLSTKLIDGRRCLARIALWTEVVASVKKQYGDRTSTVASTVNLVRPKMARLITLSVQCMFVEQSWEYMYV